MCFVPACSGYLREVKMVEQCYTGKFQRDKKGAHYETTQQTKKLTTKKLRKKIREKTRTSGDMCTLEMR